MRAPLFIIAEMSANHLGSKQRAMRIIEAAADAGADAIKFQTFRPDEMVLDKNYIIASGPWAGRKLIELYEEAYTPWEWHKELFIHARELDIVPLSSPFSPGAVDFLETLDCPIYKIASFELIDDPLIARVAKTKKQIILSTGMASKQEIEHALKVAKRDGPRDITLLHCISAYPTSPRDALLDTMNQYYFGYRHHVGISDHSLGLAVPVAAAAKGASIIEKHLTLHRENGGPDAAFSLEPDEFATMVREARAASVTYGFKTEGMAPDVQSRALRRAVYFARDMAAGEVITAQDLVTARPALGISPQNIDKIIGMATITAKTKGDPVTWESVYVPDHNH